MFVLAQGRAVRIGPVLLEGLARSLVGGGPPAMWLDECQRVGVAVCVAGTLPEDVYDRQPLIGSSIVFVCRARLDNRTELLARLDVPRSEWSRMADSEVLFRCYCEWQQQCLQYVFGDFAFVALHRDSGDIVAAVDHFATFPLFYLQHPTELVISPQLSTVLSHPEVSRELDIVALAALTVPRSLPELTAYRHIKRIPGGHYLIRRAAGANLCQWWQPHVIPCTRHRNSKDYAALASRLFEHAVNNRLRRVGGVAVLMSGGLDSTLVAATAARLLAHRGDGLTAYTAIPQPGLSRVERPGWDSSDLVHATQVARLHPNMRHVPVSTDGLCPLDLMPAMHARSRTPVRNGANHLWLGRISRMARAAGAQVILTGQRGNLTISASATLAELLSNHCWRAALTYVAQRRSLAGSSLAHFLAVALQIRLRHWLKSHDNERPGTQFLNPGLRMRLKDALVQEGSSGSARRLAAMTTNKQAWAVDPWAQWATEWRDPMSDRQLVESLLSFPPEAFLLGGYDRGLARAMGQGLVPDVVRLRRSQGAQMPEHPALLAAYVDDYRAVTDRLCRCALFQSVFDVPRLRMALDHLSRGACNLGEAQSIDRIIDVGLFMAAHGGVE